MYVLIFVGITFNHISERFLNEINKLYKTTDKLRMLAMCQSCIQYYVYIIIMYRSQQRHEQYTKILKKHKQFDNKQVQGYEGTKYTKIQRFSRSQSGDSLEDEFWKNAFETFT